MDANTRQLESIFDPNVLFQVPLFQRPYVWKEDENWEPLWDDICSLLDKHLRLGTVHAHFLGAIVLEQIPHAAGSIETRLVIDGQQRFTTLQLFLMAARNLSIKNNAKKYAALFSGLVENDEERIDSESEKFKLWPTNSDRAAFQLVHESQSSEALNLAIKNNPELGQGKIVEAYRYFYGKLSDWLLGKSDESEDSTILAGKTIINRLETVWQVVKGGLQLVVINLHQDDETQVIFETLNARGTELLPADLIKNYLFRRATGQKEDVEKLYERHWRKLESDWWREEIKQGRIKRPRVDLFINYYLSLMTRDEVKSTHLFNAFKKFVEEKKEPEEQADGVAIQLPLTPAEHIAQLAKYADVFKKFYEPGSHETLALFLRRLDAVDTATVYPFLLYAHAELMPLRQAEFDKVLGVIEAFLMRRLITNWTSKNYNRLFVDLIKAVEKSGDITGKTVAEYLAKRGGDSNKYPTDEDLRPFVFDQKFYGRIAAKKVRTVLEALDAVAHTSKSETLAMPDNLTIEHVMPQEWATFWPLADEIKADPIAEQKATIRRNILLNTLGNLTLITGSLNPALSNSAWSTKRPELKKFSKLNLTQYFHGQEADSWDEEAIAMRAEYLFKQLVAIWPDVEREPVAATV